MFYFYNTKGTLSLGGWGGADVASEESSTTAWGRFHTSVFLPVLSNFVLIKKKSLLCLMLHLKPDSFANPKLFLVPNDFGIQMWRREARQSSSFFHNKKPNSRLSIEIERYRGTLWKPGWDQEQRRLAGTNTWSASKKQLGHNSLSLSLISVLTKKHNEMKRNLSGPTVDFDLMFV